MYSVLKTRRIFWSAVLIAAVFLGTYGVGHSEPDMKKTVSVNYPPDKSVMEFDVLGVSLNVPPGSADLITVSIDGKEQTRIVPDSEFECFSTQLSVGNNMIQIEAHKGGKVVNDIFINVFRKSDLESIYFKPPAGFTKGSFHAKERRECEACHSLEPVASDKKSINPAAFSDDMLKGAYDGAAATSTCYSCHKALISFPFVHGPAAVWSCLSCHAPQEGKGYTVSKPDTKASFTCQFEKKEQWYSKKYYHGPFNTGKCSICHNPHASENPNELIKDTWDLCISCHIDKGSGEHIVKNFSQGQGSYHPTRGKPDPSRPGHELSCASCHNPHASDMPRLERYTYSALFDFCKKCHGK